MSKYKYKSTEEIYKYINKSNDFFITKAKIQEKFKNIDESKIYKALSDLNKDKVIFRTDRGEYVNHSDSLLIKKIKDVRGEKTKFNVIKALVILEKEELIDAYKNVKMYKSPYYLAHEHELTTQIPNSRICIIDLNKNINVSNELGNISSIFISDNNEVKPLTYSKHNNTINKLLIDFFKISKDNSLKGIIDIFNKEYKKLIEIEYRGDSKESPYALSKLLYTNIDRLDYETFINEGLNNYIVKIK